MVALRQSKEKLAEGGVELVKEGFTHTAKVLVFENWILLFLCSFIVGFQISTSLLFISLTRLIFVYFFSLGILVVQNMVKNTFQYGFLSILYSFGYVFFVFVLFLRHAQKLDYIYCTTIKYSPAQEKSVVFFSVHVISLCVLIILLLLVLLLRFNFS